jgi:riboflavin kinase/FMN adenylyltransferase
MLFVSLQPKKNINCLVVKNLNQINRSLFQNPIVTIGIFDGVHKGHLKIIETVKQRATEKNGESVVLTFWPHPRVILYPEKEIKLLSALDEKIELITKTGIDHLVVISFTIEFSKLSVEEFIQKVLIEKIGIVHFVIGFDNHIGHNREGGFEVIKKYGEKYNFGVEQLNAVFVDSERISSSNIRNALEQGNIEKTAMFLGYRYFITGHVVRGKNIGRQLGFPTANIQPGDHKIIPAVGVYAVLVTFEGKKYQGMLNIGYRPTFEQTPVNKTIEVHIIDFEGDLYNKEISVTFVSRIRDEKKFKGIDELTAQLNRDKQEIIKILGNKL